MGKIADILESRGDLDEALRIRREEELPVYERLGDVRARAVTMGKIADILWSRGDLDEALRIRREEQLPIYERLGDVRARAVTDGQDRRHSASSRRSRRGPAHPARGATAGLRTPRRCPRALRDACNRSLRLFSTTGGLEKGRIQEIYEASRNPSPSP